MNRAIKDLMDASDNGTLAIFVGAGVSRCANVPAVAEHGKTHELLLASQPHNIVTTNWDTLLEDADRKLCALADVYAYYAVYRLLV